MIQSTIVDSELSKAQTIKTSGDFETTYFQLTKRDEQSFNRSGSMALNS